MEHWWGREEKPQLMEEKPISHYTSYLLWSKVETESCTEEDCNYPHKSPYSLLKTHAYLNFA
jgi:hypothetical protein